MNVGMICIHNRLVDADRVPVCSQFVFILDSKKNDVVTLRLSCEAQTVKYGVANESIKVPVIYKG